MATQARVAGTVKIDGVAAARDVIVIKDDPAGRQVVAEGQSAGDGTFDITYSDWAGSVVVLALDEYGDEFAPEAALNAGQVVHPSTPNGYVYKVTVAGTTGTEEPTWSTSSSVTSGSVTFNPVPYYRPVASGPLLGEPQDAGSAVGGTETEIDIAGTIYKVHSFYESGVLDVTGSIDIEYLLVGGGGAGGSISPAGSGGGGGGGGVLLGSTTLGEGSYPVTVGEGGLNPAYSGDAFPGANGGDSVAFGLVAVGGGGGGNAPAGSGSGNDGQAGGSGGGGSGGNGRAHRSGGSAHLGQGNAGGNGLNQLYASRKHAGGGGGAGGPGSDPPDFYNSGAGGDGIEVNIRGVPEWFGGGGGGGISTYTAGLGGNGGGGNGGGGSPEDPTAGAANTGGGGGGGGLLSKNKQPEQLGPGGSGIVIVRYRVS
jgi:hypothetical protein